MIKKKVDPKIKRLTNVNIKLKEQIKALNSNIKDLKDEVEKSFGGATPQEYGDMRLRAQKAELALEAMMQNNTDYQIKRTDVKFNIKALIDKL